MTPPDFRPNLFAFAPGDVAVSFEFFPPKTEAMEQTLWQAVRALAPLHPRFVSVTYGAGGSTRERTHNTVVRILQETALIPAAHLTCVAASRDEVDEVARRYWAAGVRHIVALRGDPPEGDARFAPHPQGYENAAALVTGLKRIGDFDISVACYPERHVDSADWQAELDNLKRKVDNGASRAITQFFFDPDLYFRLVERATAAGIHVPIVPGIMPVTNFKGITSFAARCGASVPKWLAELFQGLDDHPATRQLVAAAVAAELCRRLYDGGVKEFHFYTLNRAELTYAICHTLGLRPEEKQA
ncbi:MAG: methylenetetrahydrofolate reductase [NAD(P)H] [Sphingomonadales bacterium]|nr:methylenetetrahydrofolate reductase [NAD(P)H] [Sphingomonadales bacterium]